MGRRTQDDNEDSKAQVSGSYVKDSSAPERTDFLVIDKSDGSQAHYSIDANPGSDVVQHHDYE